MEVVEISREERDVYLIPQNFVDTGTILGGTVKLRNAVEAAVLAVGSAVPLFYLPLAFNIRLMIVIAVSVPLGVFGVVGIGGDSLTQFVAHWFRFMKHRRIVTPTPQGNLEANRHRHLRFISKRYHVVYYDDSDSLPLNAQVLQRKADRHGKLVKRQTLYDLLPIEKIENGILHTTHDRYIKILEIEPINFLLRSPREQRSVIYSFASLLKVSPVRLQFKSFSRKADVNAYLDKLRLDAANEPDAAVRKRHMSYIRFVKRLGSRDAVSRRFFVIFQYEAPTNERNISYAEIVSTLETTARNFRTYLAQCGNAIVEHENEDEFLTDVFYTLLNRRTAVQVPLQERIQDVLASYLAQNDATALDKIPLAAFMIPPSLDLKHGRYLYMDGTYHAYLMIPADGYRAQVTAGCMLGIFGLFLQAAAGHILYLALHLESGSFPRPLPPDRERAAFVDLQKGGAAAAQARDTLIRHNLRLVAHICKKYYAGNSAQDDMISIGTIGLIKAVDTFDPAKGKRFASYASRCIENELRMDLRRGRRTGVTLSLQEPLEADGQLTLADTLPDEADMEAGCESRADAARLRALVDALPARERAIMRQRYGFDGAPKTQQQTAQALHISRSYV